MKHAVWTRLCILAALVCALGGCAGMPVPPAQEPAPPAESAVAAQPDGTADELAALLGEVSVGYYPGTAGCSLTAAKYAGMLLDWYARVKPDASLIGEAATAVRNGLDNEAAALFNEQLAGLGEAIRSLGGDNAADTLEAAGYTPEAFPWSAEDIEALAAALGA